MGIINQVASYLKTHGYYKLSEKLPEEPYENFRDLSNFTKIA